MHRVAVALLLFVSTTAAFAADGAAAQREALHAVADSPALPVGLRALFAHFADDPSIVRAPNGMKSVRNVKKDVIVARRMPDGSVVTACVDNEASAVGFLTAPPSALRRVPVEQ